MATSPPEGFYALLDLWARRNQLSPSQRTLLHAAVQDDGRTLHERLDISPGELEVLKKLFELRTGRTVHVAVEELWRLATRRASQSPDPLRPR